MPRHPKYYHAIISSKTGKPLKPQWQKYKRERIMGGKMFIYFGHSKTKAGAKRKIVHEMNASQFKVLHKRVTRRVGGYDLWLRYGGKKGTPW